MIITSHAYARAGLIGNPSDGYFGKTISFVIRNFAARVRIWESPYFEVIPGSGDLAHFSSVSAFLRDQKLHGYYGGMRLIKAAIKKFVEYCQKNNIELDLSRSFTVSYESDIPRLVGLSGSSAITVATFRALMRFYDVHVPKEILPSLALSVEREELGIAAGLQDRVVQVYEGIVYMDFAKELLTKRGYGTYEPLRPSALPPLYIAYDPERAEVSDIPHRNLRRLFEAGDKTVHDAMQRYREITDIAKTALLAGDWELLGRVMNENFDLRRKIMDVTPENLRMVEAARATGASAKFAGSGGAIVGLYRDGRHYQELVDALATLRCSVLRPLIFES
jgi:glucuronokinase